jgi:hypothetical protein
MLTLTNVILFNWFLGCGISWHIYQQRQYERRIKAIVARRKDFDNDWDFVKWLDQQDLTFTDFCKCVLEFLKQKTKEVEVKKKPLREPPDPRTVTH